MKRKIVKQGPATLMVSLPSSWVKRYHLNKGDELDVAEQQQQLVFSTGKIPALGKIEIQLPSGSLQFVKTVIGNAYKKGYDEVVVFYTHADGLAQLRAVVDDFLGYEIVEQTTRSVTIKSLALPSDQEFDILLRRCFLLVKEMAAAAASPVFAHGSFDPAPLAHDVTKFADFCKRLINTGRICKKEDGQFLYLIVWEIEKICRAYAQLHVLLKTETPRPMLHHYIAEASSLFSQVYDAFYQKNSAQLAQITVRKDELLYQQLPKLAVQVKGKEVLILYTTSSIIRRTHDLVGPMWGMLL
ncbi:hypothetical protein HZB02_01135 [Candidatus Woesearchaeota archaeon]|nr:hypothetical protein [Candidatus Woesearchaeota archaeon]